MTNPKSLAPLGASYLALFAKLVPGITGICVLDARLRISAAAGSLLTAHPLRRALRDRVAKNGACLNAALDLTLEDGSQLLVLPLPSDEGAWQASVAVALDSETSLIPDRAALVLAPALSCLAREWSGQVAPLKGLPDAARTTELEWLFDVTTNISRRSGEGELLERLLSAATVRLCSTLGALLLPDKQLAFTHWAGDPVPTVQQAFDQMRPHLLTWAQRRARVLMANVTSTPRRHAVTPAKFLCAPVLSHSGRVIGALAFFNDLQGHDYRSREAFLARHLARQVTQLLDAQFDLMTGLPSRASFEQRCERLCTEQPDLPR
jgi:hypothetical protein